MAKSIEIKIRNEVDELERADTQFAQFTAKHKISKEIQQKFQVALDEMLNNVVSNAYQDDGVHIIEIKVELANKQLSVEIADDGIPFDPTQVLTPDTSLSVEDREIGGLGIHMVRNLMDEFRYQRKDNKNFVTLVMNA